MTSNPYDSPTDDPEATAAPGGQPLDGRAAYNIVSDTVFGVNTRRSDNRFQLISILISVAVCALVGTVVMLINGPADAPWFIGTVLGVFAGLVIGTFASGIFLMIYRGIRHIRGQHD